MLAVTPLSRQPRDQSTIGAEAGLRPMPVSALCRAPVQAAAAIPHGLVGLVDAVIRRWERACTVNWPTLMGV